MLDNIWIKAGHHWLQIHSGEHGNNFSFQEVVKRNSEVTLESELFWIEDSADDLVQAIMAEAGIEGFVYSLVLNELVVLDE